MLLPVTSVYSAGCQREKYLGDYQETGNKEEPGSVDIELSALRWFEEEALSKTEGSK